MIYRYLLVILLSLLTSVSCGLATKEQDNRAYYDPTPVELQQGTAFAAPKYWGVNIRRSKSLRVAFIGGSQTRQGHYIRAFYEAMNETITKMKSNWNFAIYNEGMSGSAPKIRSYKFFGSNASEWPNVIGIEPCLNCAHKKKIVYHGCSTDIDNLKYFINREYSQRGLDVPSYFFIEFFRASEHLWELSSLSRNWDLLPRKALPINASKANELTFDGRDREVYTRGTMYAPFMMDFARFYGMPVLSEADVLYPSYVRFFLTHTDNERWPYTMEGRHTSYEGSALVGKHILRPFFLDQMLPRESDKLYDKSPQFGPYPVDLRMFRASQYKEEHIIKSWRTWGGEVYVPYFKALVNANNDHWSFTNSRGHADGDHICYGTNTSTQVFSQLTFNITSNQCNSGMCRLKIEYLHSWDTSYISDAVCDLYAFEEKTNDMQLIDSVSIVANMCDHHHHHHHPEAVTGTLLCSHTLHLKPVLAIEQPFSLQCRSKELGKLACIGSVSVYVKGSESEHRVLSSDQDNRNFYDPTPVELQQGTAFAAPKYWGVHIRRSKSLRVAFIGGAQTSSATGYVDYFRTSMKAASDKHGWSLAVYSESLNMTYSSTHHLRFLALPKAEWPNVICIEPCLECVTPDHRPCSYSIDNMKYAINRQYKEQGLDLPYYIFLEFFSASDVYWAHRKEWLGITTRTVLPVNVSSATELSDDLNKRMFSRGAPYALYMMDLARFYGMPVLSVTDVLYPSWVRFRLTHDKSERWPYTADGIYTSDEGCQLVAEHILKPFFVDQMLPRESDKMYEKELQFDPYPADVRMFSSDHYHVT